MAEVVEEEVVGFVEEVVVVAEGLLEVVVVSHQSEGRQ